MHFRTDHHIRLIHAHDIEKRLDLHRIQIQVRIQKNNIVSAGIMDRFLNNPAFPPIRSVFLRQDFSREFILELPGDLIGIIGRTVIHNDQLPGTAKIVHRGNGFLDA